MVYGITLSYGANPACLVISRNGHAVTAISLYSPEKATFDHYNAMIQPDAGMYGLANKDPSDHEEIHSEMGRLMSRDPESTKTFTTHFHWVCKEPLSAEQFGAFLMQTLTKTKAITRAQMTGLLQALLA